MRIHSNVRHQCSVCTKCFSSEDSLRKHVRRMHSSLRATCACGTTVTEDDMHRHMRICPAHNLRREHLWDSFPIVDEDNAELERNVPHVRPFTMNEYVATNLPSTRF